MRATRQHRIPIVTDRPTFLLVAMVCVMLIFFTGCSKPSKWLVVQVQSDPPGAWVDDQLANSLGQTPTRPKLLYRSQRGMLFPMVKQELTIWKEGFESATVSLDAVEYKYSSKEEALRNVRIIKVALKPQVAGDAARSSLP